MGKKTTEIDRAIAGNQAKIRELEAVNEALRALQEAKRKLKKPRPLARLELRVVAKFGVAGTELLEENR